MPKVSSTKEHIRDEFGEVIEWQRTIYVDSNGMFYTPVPEHIDDVFDALGIKEMNEYRNSLIRSKNMMKNSPDRMCLVGFTKEDLIELFDRTARTYEQWQRNNQSVKHIAVTFESNVHHIKGFHDVGDRTDFVGYGSYRGDISFTGAPAMHINYEIVYKIGSNLFRKDRSGRYVTYATSRSDKNTHVILHTDEREAFFESIVEGLSQTICRIKTFFDDLESNTDMAIEHRQNLLLPMDEVSSRGD